MINELENLKSELLSLLGDARIERAFSRVEEFLLKDRSAFRTDFTVLKARYSDLQAQHARGTAKKYDKKFSKILYGLIYFVEKLCEESIQAIQHERKKQIGDQITEVNKQGIEMTLVKRGSFKMGNFNGEGHAIEKPAHEVEINNFWMSVRAVTFTNFHIYCEAKDRKNPKGEWGEGDYPITEVDWYDAIEYCNWLSEVEGLEPAYQVNKDDKDPYNLSEDDQKKWAVVYNWEANGYRLPTEAEWEYAARSPRHDLPVEPEQFALVVEEKKVIYGNGLNEADFNEINFRPFDPKNPDDHGRESCVKVDALKRCANGLGIKHMSGNVWEWCWDWYDAHYYKHPYQYANPRGPPQGSKRCCRGGSWNASRFQVRTTSRASAYPNMQDNQTGFRLARNYKESSSP